MPSLSSVCRVGCFQRRNFLENRHSMVNNGRKPAELMRRPSQKDSKRCRRPMPALREEDGSCHTDELQLETSTAISEEKEASWSFRNHYGRRTVTGHYFDFIKATMDEIGQPGAIVWLAISHVFRISRISPYSPELKLVSIFGQLWRATGSWEPKRWWREPVLVFKGLSSVQRFFGTYYFNFS